MVSFTAPYFLPLFLGMTFDARHSKPGVDIFDAQWVDDPQVEKIEQTTSFYRVLTEPKDVGKALNISGDLSLKLRGGLIAIEGMGSFLKVPRDYSNTVEILANLEWTSSVKSLKEEARPRDNWAEQHSAGVLGSHYVSGITYGARMIASLRLEVTNKSYVEEVRGRVKADFKSKGNITEVVAEGKLANMVKDLREKCNMAISFFGTMPLKAIPNDIEGFQNLVLNFRQLVEEANLTDGIPMEVHLTPLVDIADDPHKEQFKYSRNTELEDKLAIFENMLDEMRQARSDLIKFAKGLPYHLDEEYEKEVGRLIRNITLTMSVFYDTIWKMDLTGGPEQLQPALDAYDYDGQKVQNRYRDLVRQLIEKLNPLIKRDEVAGDTFIHWGKSSCTGANTQVLYEGFAFSSTEEGLGGAAQYECAPKSPEKGYDLEDGEVNSHLAGIRYTKLDDEVNPFKGENAKDISAMGVTCAKCYSPDSSSVVTFSATETCPLTWEKMYTGYLMSTREKGPTTEYVCVDDTPAPPYKMDDQDFSRNSMALTVVQSSGSLPSETYVNNALVRCAVCAMKSNQISF